MKSRFNPKGKPTKAESRHMALIAQQPCARCGQMGSQVHHLVDCGRRLGNFHTMALCPFHHRMIYELTFQEQLELCRKEYKRLGIEFIEPTTKIVRRYEENT